MTDSRGDRSWRTESLGIGVVLGVIIGLLLGNLGIGIAIGIALGAAYGEWGPKPS